MVCHQGPPIAACQLLNVHQKCYCFGQCCKDLCSSDAYCNAFLKPSFYKAFVIFVHSRREGEKTSYKYIGKMFDIYPGCTWEMVVVLVMLNLTAESFDASAL